MRGELVALDLETTGLDPNLDSIIEIGAVRMQDGKITAEFSTLVNPGGPIPATVTYLTGIHTEDVIGAPTILAVLPEIQKFVGDVPIIAHNISFDLGFFRRHGILQSNPRIDTYELASVLLPRAARYNLNSLTHELHIELEHAHRALDDARAAALLYWALWQKSLTLPFETLREIVEAAQGLDWDAQRVLLAAAEEQQKTGNLIPTPNLSLLTPYTEAGKPVQHNEQTAPLDVDHVIRLLDIGGPLQTGMPSYEHRAEQIQMAEAIARAFNTGKHLIVEAGTGTGKSIAYLVPAILWAAQNQERVIISTNTINLQDQLVRKDIPALSSLLQTDFRAAVLKGRGNYLCPRRLATTRRRKPSSTDELRTLAKILVWSLECETGDKSDISLRGSAEHIIWQRLSAEDEGCTLERCATTMQGSCPFYKARRKAEAAHLLIVNHALLVSDAASDNRVLPDYRYVVIDEGHQLEDAVTNGMAFRIDRVTLQRRIVDLGTPTRGILGDLLASLRERIPQKDLNRLADFIKQISEAAGLMVVHVDTLFSSATSFVLENRSGPATEFNTQVLITLAQRNRPGFAQLQANWVTLNEFFEVIADAMGQLATALRRLEKYEITNLDDLLNSATTAQRYFIDLQQHLNAFFLEQDTNAVYWMNLNQAADGVSLHAAPLHVGPLIEKYVWHANDAVILTSATLRTTDSFDYIRDRLFAEDVQFLEVGSPFNYQESTLIYIPEDIPEPNYRQEYQHAVERGLIELAAALNGRVMALFTSYGQLRQTAQAIGPRLALGNITVYDQSDGTSREALLEGFKSPDKAVLLGTRSFWEGVDIPGESLSALVIVRLPFAVPSDPIFAARSETYADSFKQYALPDAILRFRQGFGRLIRSRSDRGIITIFDSRILSKSYGSSFLESLPDCTIQYGPLAGLATAATTWLKF